MSTEDAQVRPRVAAIVVGYGTRWHADNLVTRLLAGYRINHEVHDPPVDVVSLYVDRRWPDDLVDRITAQHGIALRPTIASALTLDEGTLAVDGVVVVTEAPGRLVPFPENPYRRFAEEVFGVLRASGRAVPVFWDKQYAARWEDSRWIHDEARALGVPLLAGSVIPATFRRPPIELPLGAPIADALVVAALPPEHLQSIAFHAIELLLSLVERRPDGERGIRRLELLEGPAVWAAGRSGRWSEDLFEAAIARSETRAPGPPEGATSHPLALLIEHRDGLRTAIISAPGFVADFTAAVRLHGRDEPLSTLAYYVTENGNSFSCLAAQIEELMLTGLPAVPAERTLLASGVIDRMLVARTMPGWIETPELAVGYQPPVHQGHCPGPGA